MSTILENVHVFENFHRFSKKCTKKSSRKKDSKIWEKVVEFFKKLENFTHLKRKKEKGKGKNKTIQNLV